MEANDLLKRGNSIFQRKQNYDSLCQEIAWHFFPEYADFTSEISVGEEIASHITDASPIFARRELGEMFGSMLRPAAKPWFAMAVEGFKQPDVGSMEAKFLEYGTHKLRSMLYDRRARFKATTKTIDHHYAGFGGGVMSCTANRTRDGLMFNDYHLRDCAWACDENGFVNEMHRKAKMEAVNIVAKFPEAVARQEFPQAIRDAAEGSTPGADPYQKFKVRHICMPAKFYKPSSKKSARGSRKSDYVSIWILDEATPCILRETYQPEFMYIVPRWQTPSGNPWPISPAAIVALPTARLIQRMAASVIDAAELATVPPLIATQEAVKGQVNFYSGGITWLQRDYDERTGEAIRAFDMKTDVSRGASFLDRIERQLGEAFYLNKLTLPTNRGKTAYETARLVEEYVRNALPLFEPMEDDYNGAILETSTQIAKRLGVFGPAEDVPKGLRGKEITFQFMNPLREAIEASKVKAFGDVSNMLAIAAKFDPKSMNEIKVSTMLREAAGAAQAPSGWFNTAQEAADISDKQDQAAQAQAGLQQAAAAGEIAKSGVEAAATAKQAGIDMPEGDGGFMPDDMMGQAA